MDLEQAFYEIDMTDADTKPRGGLCQMVSMSRDSVISGTPG